MFLYESDFMVLILNILTLALLGGSLAMWLEAGRRRSYGAALVRWQPRRPVPWGFWAALPATLMAGLAVVSFWTVPEPEADAMANLTDGELINWLLTNAVFFALLLAVVVLALVKLCGATRIDLGLPTTANEWLGDLGLGFVAAIAAYLPLVLIQAVAINLFVDRTHPLLNMLTSDPRPMVMVASAVLAVLMAPLIEEVLFRLMLQGAMERWEWGPLPTSAQTSTEASTEVSTEAVSETHPDSPVDLQEAVRQIDALSHDTALRLRAELSAAEAANPFAAPRSEDGPTDQPVESAAPPYAGYGVRSMVVSSLLFALAHVAQWPSPIPLFFLALMLGYLYLRTHRIVPSIVAHATFNGISVALATLSSGVPQP